MLAAYPRELVAPATPTRFFDLPDRHPDRKIAAEHGPDFYGERC
jgi:hypothetical protein